MMQARYLGIIIGLWVSVQEQYRAVAAKKVVAFISVVQLGIVGCLQRHSDINMSYWRFMLSLDLGTT